MRLGSLLANGELCTAWEVQGSDCREASIDWEAKSFSFVVKKGALLVRVTMGLRTLHNCTVEPGGLR